MQRSRANIDYDSFECSTIPTGPKLASSGDPETVPYLVMTSGPRPGSTAYAVNGRPVILGSDPAADIGIPDPTIAPAHARISGDALGYVVDDLGSPSGTFVDGERITRAVLRDGDRLRLGAVELTFYLRHKPGAGHEARTQALLPPPTEPEPIVAQDQRPPELAAPDQLGPARASALPDAGPSAEQLARKLFALSTLVRRHLGLLVACVGTGMATGLTSFSTHPPPARASCEIALHVDRVSPLEPNRLSGQADLLQFFSSAEQAFRGQDLVRGTLAQLGAPRDDESAGRALSGLELSSQGTTWSASYAATAHDPVAFLEQHLARWVKAEVGRKLKVMTAEVDFLRTQMASLDREMAEVSARAVAFREQHLDRLPDHNPVTADTRAQLEARRVEVSATVVRLEGELEGVRRQLDRGSPFMQAKVQSSQRHREALTQAEHRLSELRAQGLADGHPEVKRILEQERDLQRLMSEELVRQTTPVDRIANPDYERLRIQAEGHQASLRAARAELRDLQGGLGRLQRISKDLPRVSAQLDDLSKTEGGLQRLHVQLFDRLRRAELELELERVAAASRFETVVAPHLEPARIKRLLAMRLLLGVGLGLCVALGVLGVRRMRELLARVAREAASHPQ